MTAQPDHAADRRAAELAGAAAAARIRALALDTNVIALQVERIRAQVDACAWIAIGLGLAFTAVNVQTFAAAGAPTWSPGWLVAWLLDPMVSLLLIAVLRAEQVTARWQVATGRRVRAAKWGCFAATYAMNTWASWTSGTPSGVVLHSVPPLVVLLGAEVAPELRDRLTAAVAAAATSGQRPTVDERPDLSGEAASAAGDRGQDRDAVPPGLATAQPRPGPDDEPALQPDPLLLPDGADGATGDDGLDPRAFELAELLAAGCSVTGPQAAVLHTCSVRTGRRLLRDARTHLDLTTAAGHDAGHAHSALHLVDSLTAGVPR